MFRTSFRVPGLCQSCRQHSTWLHFGTWRWQTIRRFAKRLLEQKGFVSHERDGLRYVYSTTLAQGKAKHRALKKVVSTLGELAKTGSEYRVKISLKPHVGNAMYSTATALKLMREVDTDWIGLNGTHDPAAAKGLFTNFLATGLQDPSPPGWVHVILDDHPTLLQRVEMVEAWKRRRP